MSQHRAVAHRSDPSERARLGLSTRWTRPPQGAPGSPRPDPTTARSVCGKQTERRRACTAPATDSPRAPRTIPRLRPHGDRAGRRAWGHTARGRGSWQMRLADRDSHLKARLRTADRTPSAANLMRRTRITTQHRCGPVQAAGARAHHTMRTAKQMRYELLAGSSYSSSNFLKKRHWVVCT